MQMDCSFKVFCLFAWITFIVSYFWMIHKKTFRTWNANEEYRDLLSYHENFYHDFGSVRCRWSLIVIVVMFCFTLGTQTGIKLYMKEIFDLVQPLLTSSSWGLRAQAARSIAVAAESLGIWIELHKFWNM